MSKRVFAGVRLLLTFTFLLALADAAPARAATYYVAANGRDSNTGASLSSPFQTVMRAAAVAGPGDTVLIRAGVYREEVDLSRSRGGAPGRPLTFKSYNGEAVAIEGSDPVTGWTPDSGGVWKKTGWTVNTQQLFADGKPLQQIGAQSPFQTEPMNTNDGSGKPDLRLPPVGSDIHSLVPDSFFYDSAAQTLYCQLGDQSSPASHFMEASVRDSVFDGAGKSFITLSGLSFLHSNGTAGGGYPGVVSVDGSGWTIDNCTIQNGDFAGLRMSGDHHIVRSCRILDNGDVGINLSGSDAAHNYGPWLDRPSQQILLTGLVVSGNNYRHFNENWHAGGIKGIPSMRGVTVRDCRVLDNDAAGIWFDTDYGDNVIENNLVVRNHTGITVEINQPGGPDSFGSIVRNNRVAFNTGQGIYISASSGATVANNTCYHNDFGIVVHGMPRSDGGAAFQLRDDIVKDNIVDGKWDDIVLYQGDNAVGNTLDGDFYVINGPGGIKLSVTNVSNYNLSAYDLGTAQQKYGFEKSGESGNPEWISPDTLDFHLRPGSPAAGKGWQVPAN